MNDYRCTRCGGELEAQGDQFICKYCHRNFTSEIAAQNARTMADVLDEARRQTIYNLRAKLYKEITSKNISRKRVKSICEDLLTYIPDDFMAEFFLAAAGEDVHELNEKIMEFDVEESYEDVDMIVEFLINSMDNRNYLLALNDLVERAYKYKKRDLHRFHAYATMISEKMTKIDAGVYITALHRDVFVAYSSQDMPHVMQLVEYLEDHGLKCFVAARNLRHGMGAVENYNDAIQEAIDNCSVVVFVSTVHSRNWECDALRLEMKYVAEQDTASAPSQYRNDYDTMPSDYKKPRVEYRLDTGDGSAGDSITTQYFTGFEWAYEIKDVYQRICQYLSDPPKPVPDSPKPPVPPVKKKERRRRHRKETRPATEGLTFIRVTGNGYAVTGIDAIPEFGDLVVPAMYEGLPVVEIYEHAFHARQPSEAFITSVSLPDTLLRIGASAFMGQTHLTTVTLPAHITDIGIQAFAQCENLTEIILPKKLLRIDNYAFAACDRLVDIVFPKKMDSIGTGAFIKCTHLRGIVIPKGIRRIEEQTFAQCENLIEITMPRKLMHIGNYAFSSCEKLVDIAFPRKMKSIGSGAFTKCTLLRKIAIPKGIRRIEEQTFAQCNQLTEIFLPRSVTFISSTAFNSTRLTFIRCRSGKHSWKKIRTEDTKSYDRKHREKIIIHRFTEIVPQFAQVEFHVFKTK